MLWRWREAAPPQHAEIVVCAPVCCEISEREGDPFIAWMASQETTLFVVPFVRACSFEAWANEWCRRASTPFPKNIVPAVYAEHQADLEDLHVLIRIRTRRHALVISAKSPINLKALGQGIDEIVDNFIEHVFVVPL